MSRQPALGSRAMELESKYMMQTYKRIPVTFVMGAGCHLYDAEGRDYLDFLAGISVVQIGHCHPALVAAVSASGSSRGTAVKPGTSGAKGSCLSTCGVADSAPIVRP